MYTIVIGDTLFDSLVNWTSVYDILDANPFLTYQESRIASNFHRYTDEGMKAHVLYTLVNSMFSKSSVLTEEQVVLVSELVNFDSDLKYGIVEAFNKISKKSGFMIVWSEGDSK